MNLMTVINQRLAQWCYSNHHLITRLKISLNSSGFLVRVFWSWFCKLILFNTAISSQNNTIPSAPRNQTRPYNAYKYIKEKKRRPVYVGTQKRLKQMLEMRSDGCVLCYCGQHASAGGADRSTPKYNPPLLLCWSRFVGRTALLKLLPRQIYG